jgi:hypothetical protein
VVETWTGHASLNATPEGGGCSLKFPMSPAGFERACNLIPNVTVTVFVTTRTGQIARLYSASLTDADWETLHLAPCTVLPACTAASASALQLYHCERVLRLEASICGEAVVLTPMWWWCARDGVPQETDGLQSKADFLLVLERGGLFAPSVLTCEEEAI